MKALTHSKLHSILVELGFKKTLIKGSHFLFVWPATTPASSKHAVVILLPITARNAKARHHVLGSETTVVMNGIASLKRWRELVAAKTDA